MGDSPDDAAVPLHLDYPETGAPDTSLAGDDAELVPPAPSQSQETPWWAMPTQQPSQAEPGPGDAPLEVEGAAAAGGPEATSPVDAPVAGDARVSAPAPVAGVPHPPQDEAAQQGAPQGAGARLTAEEEVDEMLNWLGPRPKRPTAPAPPRPMDAGAVAQQLQQQRQRETATAAAISTRCPPRLYPTDIEGDSVPVTFEGKRVYVKIDAPPSVSDLLEPTTTTTTAPTYGRWQAGSLLGRSIGDMLGDMERSTTASIMAETARLAAAMSAAADADLVGMPGPDDDDVAMVDTSHQEVDTQLWVDKYAPKVFTDLLSDEATNRQVLQWLKAWDACVFAPKQGRGAGGAGGAGGAAKGKRPMPAPAPAGGSAKRHAGRRSGGGSHVQQRHDGASDAAARSRAFALEREAAAKPVVGEDGRPHEKLLLMAGPPGLGKTTLAHVVAKHCGYRVVDVNASDERGAEGLRTRVMDAMQMRALGSDGRPNCIILDEIDGAIAAADGRGAIGALVALARSDEKAGRGGDGDDDAAPPSAEPKSRRRGAAAKPSALTLQRPVVCICNDLSAPALRPLRDVARVFRFVPPTPARLAARLADIARQEGMVVEARALTLLAERTHCDVRAALHALQLLQRTRRRVAAVDVLAVVGEKDMTVGPMDAWRALFTLGSAQHKAKQQQRGASDFEATLGLLHTVGDHQLVLTGVFENLANVRFTDTLLHKTSAAAAHLSDGDLLASAAMRGASWACMGYVPLASMAVRALVASQGERPAVEWPHAAQALPRDLAQKQQQLAAWRLTCSPSVRASLGSHAACDLVPFMLTCLGPGLRTMSVHAMAPAERLQLDELVDTMVAYGLTYAIRNATDSSGAYTSELALEPALDVLTRCDGLADPPQRRQLVQSLRQVVAHHCMVEAIKRAEVARLARAPQGVYGSGEGQQGGDEVPGEVQQQQQENTAGLAAQLMEQYNRAAGVGRKRMSTGGPSVGLASYKFNEGFTNAVRRVVFIKELM